MAGNYFSSLFITNAKKKRQTLNIDVRRLFITETYFGMNKQSLNSDI